MQLDNDKTLRSYYLKVYIVKERPKNVILLDEGGYDEIVIL